MGEVQGIDDFLETVRRYTDAATITKRMVAELIDHIEVYHAEKQDGVTNQRVIIHYNCIGAFDVPDRRKIPEADIIMETRKGVALSYAPEQAAVGTLWEIKKQSVHYRILRSYKDTLHVMPYQNRFPVFRKKNHLILRRITIGAYAMLPFRRATAYNSLIA